MREKAIEVRQASKSFKKNDAASIREQVFRIFRSRSVSKHAFQVFSDLSFDVYKGEVFGIIGKNGCGKSTLLKAMMGSIKLSSGEIVRRGKIIRLALGQGFDPDMTARQNIYLLGSLMGLTFEEIGHRFSTIVDFADIHQFLDMEVKYFSTGMKNRLSFAVAQFVEADIYLMDEFFSGVGDVNFKKKSFDVFNNTMINNKTIVFVSHNLIHLEKYCHRLLLLAEGRIVKIGDPREVIEEYKSIMKSYKK